MGNRKEFYRVCYTDEEGCEKLWTTTGDLCSASLMRIELENARPKATEYSIYKMTSERIE